MSEKVFPQLITASFTVKELAQCSAGLILARRLWASHVQEATMVRNESQRNLGLQRIEEITNLLCRIQELPSAEQMRAEMRDNG